jgi:hypothetical protein
MCGLQVKDRFNLTLHDVGAFILHLIIHFQFPYKPGPNIFPPNTNYSMLVI